MAKKRPMDLLEALALLGQEQPKPDEPQIPRPEPGPLPPVAMSGPETTISPDSLQRLHLTRKRENAAKITEAGGVNLANLEAIFGAIGGPGERPDLYKLMKEGQAALGSPEEAEAQRRLKGRRGALEATRRQGEAERFKMGLLDKASDAPDPGFALEALIKSGKLGDGGPVVNATAPTTQKPTTTPQRGNLEPFRDQLTDWSGKEDKGLALTPSGAPDIHPALDKRVVEPMKRQVAAQNALPNLASLLGGGGPQQTAEAVSDFGGPDPEMDRLRQQANAHRDPNFLEVLSVLASSLNPRMSPQAVMQLVKQVSGEPERLRARSSLEKLTDRRSRERMAQMDRDQRMQIANMGNQNNLLRTLITDAGATGRTNTTVAGAMDRTNVTQAGANARNLMRINNRPENINAEIALVRQALSDVFARGQSVRVKEKALEDQRGFMPPEEYQTRRAQIEAELDAIEADRREAILQQIDAQNISPRMSRVFLRSFGIPLPEEEIEAEVQDGLLKNTSMMPK